MLKIGLDNGGPALGKSRINKNLLKQSVPKMGMICYLNEFGEGSYIEPTETQEYFYIDKIKIVFGVGVCLE
ncbi:MAG: hypothetical protein WAV82_13720 [Methylobacter sp.]